MKTCVIVPTNFSKYSLAICEMLQQRDIDLSLILCPSTVNLKRIKTYWKREKVDFIRKIWLKILLRNQAVHKTALDMFCHENNISTGKISAWAKRKHIRFLLVHELNSSRTAEIIRSEQCDLGIFTGGGLIRKILLQSFPLGILNSHRGILPGFRGMDTHIWAEWEKKPTGLTLHYMNQGVDTGPILLRREIPRKPEESIALFEERTEVTSVTSIIECVVKIKEGLLVGRPQDTAEGKQYYVLHKRFKKTIIGILENKCVE